jgi:glycosyltransferase involved in cell wall biosynthesis
MSNLLFVGPYPPPFGGISSHLADVLPALAAEGHSVRCLHLAHGEEFLKKDGITLVRRDTRALRPLRVPGMIAAVVRFTRAQKGLSLGDRVRIVNAAALIASELEREPADMVFLYDMEAGLSIPVLRDVYSCTPPLSLMVFGSVYSRAERYRRVIRYVRTALDECAAVLASSRYCADGVATSLSLDHTVEVVYVGVDESTYSPDVPGAALRAELKIPASDTVLLFLGRMLPEMGLDVVLEQADAILAMDGTHLIIAGAQGKLSAPARALADRHPKVRFCPEVPAARKPAYYAASDIVLSPTRETQACMGVTIKEAMASGRAVVATATGGIPEAVEDGEQGMLIPLRDGRADGSALVTAIHRLVADGDARQRMGDAGRRRTLELFTNEQTVRKYLRLIERMSAGHPEAGNSAPRPGINP